MSDQSNYKSPSLGFYIFTLGCKVNQHESQQMGERLRELGMTAVSSGKDADIIIINSCTVTSTADQKTRQTLRRARRENPDAVICLTGCVPQAFPEKAIDMREADIIIGNSNRESIPSYILKFLADRQPIADILPHSPTSGVRGGLTDFGERTRSYIKIEDGCDRFCSYCIIPFARGRVRSRPLEEIRLEAQALSCHYREVVLVGINLCAYGSDIGLNLADAVKAAADVNGIERIRFGSVEPDLLTDGLLDYLREEKKFCPQFHMSLQSGCDATLKRMNRHYDTADYMRLVEKIRERFDNPSITTDVMVGFPGETDDEFEQSLNFFKSVGFARAHCFAYSRREGTAAAGMPDKVAPEISKKRSDVLIKAAEKSTEDFLRSQIGTTASVLAEREVSEMVYEGYSKNYTPVLIKGACERGVIYNVLLTSVERGFCVGNIIK